MTIRVSVLVNRAAKAFGVSPELIVGRRRLREYVRPRFAVCLAARDAGRSYAEIGRTLGGRDHTTIIHACDRAVRLRESSPEFAAKYAALTGAGQ